MSRELIKVPLVEEDGTEKEINIFIKNPSNEIISMSERYRAKVFNQCLMDGILTKTELHKMMNERGLWSKDKDKKHDELTQEIIVLEKNLYLGDGKQKTRDLDDGRKIAIRIRELRIELKDLIAQKIQLEENTAESIADNAKFDYLVAFCTHHENGEKVYKNIDDYNLKSSDSISFMAAAKLAEMMYNLDTSYEKNLPENKWLSDYDLVNEDLSLVGEDGELVDTEGRKIDENGRYINNKGEWVDKDGNLLNEDGLYISNIQYKTKTKKKTTATRSKRTVKSDSAK